MNRPASCLLFAGNLKDRATRAWSDDAPPHLALSPASSIPESAVRWKREGCDMTGDMLRKSVLTAAWKDTLTRSAGSAAIAPAEVN